MLSLVRCGRIAAKRTAPSLRIRSSRLDCALPLQLGPWLKLPARFRSSDAAVSAAAATIPMAKPETPIIPSRERTQLYPLSPYRTVPDHIPAPPYARNPDYNIRRPARILIKSPEQILAMRKANTLASRMRRYAGSLVKPGITTDEIDEAVHNKIVSLGAYPAPLHYMGFPKSICTSINDGICHGIPDMRPLQLGDILKIDVSVFVDGHFGDCCGTFVVGGMNVLDEDGKRLVRTTKESLRAAIEVCRAGVPLNTIGKTIHTIAAANGIGVVRTYWGHGIGTQMHEPPMVMHHTNNDTTPLQKGMTFTIEPMLTEGEPEERILIDGWTVATEDGMRSAQFEETLLISPETGLAEILTVDDDATFGKYWPLFADAS